ncbi:hypothetical protein [Xylella fastidiosa]|uniref:Uncharacterized protein n=2 Tax=Xylella fastidiosa TaxID=2371 RepID=Q9PHC8_XYLFA|nr:hypothetical protein [Xylella fastidiosa]AAF82829.1 hypothetical protein XF_0016 [Xylella fastidiosa 9a5c]ALR07908.1 hypothetical protein XFFB_00070 [Xylella fastidiosa]KXB11314.1 hypothetical protein ADT29_12140 [Xylella fastidiosa]KXB19802.1 hypothetical protein ADT28_09150 [Xylella fastidiosa]MDG5823212.1 hypothetical protein [Xylella fastidiosa subsp. pauca]
MSTPSSARTFVKVVAFMSLGLGALSLLTSLLSIVHLELFPDEEHGTLQGLWGVPIPPRLSWVLRDTLELSLANGALSLLFICVGCGLLYQREWARRGIMALLLFVTLVNFSFLPLIGVLFDTVMTLLTLEMIVAPETTTLLHQARLTLLGVGVVVAIAVAVLNGWMIWRFRAPEMRAQFH